MGVGDATVFNAFLRDITARREAEREVSRLAVIVEASEDAIVSVSLDGTVTTWNAGAERLYGYTAEEMIGQPITRLLPSGDFSEVLELRERLCSGGRLRDFETRELHKDGHLIDVSVSMSSLTDEFGQVVGVASIVRDVSERKASERALSEAWERFQGAFVSAPIGMALVGLDDQLHMDVAFLGELLDGHEVLRAVHGDGTGFGVQTGTELPLPETLRQRMVNGGTPRVDADSSIEGELAGLAPVRNGGLGGYVGVPLRFPDGRLYGAAAHAQRRAATGTLRA